MNIPPVKPVVLLVDDDPGILLSVGDRLNDEGYTVIRVDSAEAALGSLELHQVNLVVLDITIPGLGGLGFLRKASQHPAYGNIPVLIFTARANLKEFFDTTGAAGFVPKTAAPELLISSIKSILEKQVAHEKRVTHDAIAHRIMIVDDDEAVRHHLVRLFKLHGMNPHPLADVGEIIDVATTHKPHAILLKYLLPQVSGPSIARILGDTHATRQIPVILYDDSGIHRRMDDPFPNVAKFIAVPNDAEFIKAVTQVLSTA